MDGLPALGCAAALSEPIASEADLRSVCAIALAISTSLPRSSSPGPTSRPRRSIWAVRWMCWTSAETSGCSDSSRFSAGMSPGFAVRAGPGQRPPATCQRQGSCHGREVVDAAVSNRVGQMRFVTGRFSESRAARDDESAIAVPTVDLFDQPPVDLLKMDIEGGEWPILEDARLPGLAARAIVMEWHSGEICCSRTPARMPPDYSRGPGSSTSAPRREGSPPTACCGRGAELARLDARRSALVASRHDDVGQGHASARTGQADPHERHVAQRAHVAMAQERRLEQEVEP